GSAASTVSRGPWFWCGRRSNHHLFSPGVAEQAHAADGAQGAPRLIRRVGRTASTLFPRGVAEGRPMDSMSFSLQSWSRPLAKVCGVVFGVAALAVPAFAQTRTDLVERGRYLVE